jgi:RNA polymerase sigma-70 factor (ECF subfamily)
VSPNHQTATDAELLATQDPDAFAVIYDRHAGDLFAWARARVGEQAADLTAEVFARAWLRRKAFRDEAGGSAFPWLLGIAQNVLRDSLRKRTVENRARARLGLPLEVAPDPAYDQVERRLSLPEAALAAIRELPDRERKLLELRIVQERPYNEIAERMQTTPQAVRLRVSRTLRRLNLSLGGEPR